LRVSWTLSPARLRRAGHVVAFAFALIPAAPAPAQETAGAAARAHLEKGRELTTRREYDQALAELDEALRLAADGADLRLTGQIQAARGQAFYWKRDWPRMKEAYETAAALFDQAGAFRDEALAWRGLIFSAALSWKEKEQIITHAAEVLRRDPDPEVEGLVLHRWGEILVNQGYYGRGLEKLELALVKLEGSTDDDARARLLTSLGRARRLHGQPEAALRYYDEALRIQTRRQDFAGAAQTENAISVALRYQDRLRDALAHSTRAVALAERSGVAQLIAFNRLQRAEFLTDLGDDRGALRELGLVGEALHPSDVPSWLTALAAAKLRLGRKQEALSEASKAVDGARGGDPYHLLHALATRARSLQALGRQAEALGDAREALAVVETLRAGLTAEDQARQGFSDAFQRVFSTAISLLVQAGSDLAALEVAEQARARALLDVLTTRDLAPTTSDAARDAQRQQLVDAAPISGPAMRAALARIASTLVAYWVADDETVVWVLGSNGTVHAHRFPMTATRLRSLTASLGAPGTAVRGEDPARVLYDVLVKPVEPWLPAKTGGRITIVPHGPLFALPFAALRDPQGRYLIERWAPHYATSMSVLDRLESRPAGHSAGILVVAEPTLDASLHRHEGLAPLPAARKEAEAVLRRLPLAPATTLTGPEATPAAVRQAAESRSVVHFATHAVVSDTRPLESFLALAPGDGNDGRLTSAEVYGWRLRADLVVLSACRTARGRVNGDGVIGLSRAFAYAGTPSLIASVWDTPDQTSRELFPTFYAEWQRTGDRAGALRMAQLDLIRRLRAGEISLSTPAGTVTLRESPGLWAPFVLLGEP